MVHSGVQPTSASSQLDNSQPEQEQRHKKIRFSPPADQFTLCHYQSSSLAFLPVRGFYQMKVSLSLSLLHNLLASSINIILFSFPPSVKGDSTIKILVQLKLNESVKNSFEFFDVQIPFFNRLVSTCSIFPCLCD